ncbi:MAG TPA: hypothetical protein VNK03_03865 [Gammaproteobacteria bacterium]|nr:hypothetical protein [Gammaproteobacteria bacterium]
MSVEFLCEVDFFNRVGEIMAKANSLKISRVCVAPSYYTLQSDKKLNIILDDAACSLEERLDFQEYLREIYGSKFKMLFSSFEAIEEVLTAKDPMADSFEFFRDSAISIEKLLASEPLESQWARQRQQADVPLVVEKKSSSEQNDALKADCLVQFTRTIAKEKGELTKQLPNQTAAIVANKKQHPLNLTTFEESVNEPNKKRRMLPLESWLILSR